jgi:hypothetical protein
LAAGSGLATRPSQDDAGRPEGGSWLWTVAERKAASAITAAETQQ